MASLSHGVNLQVKQRNAHDHDQTMGFSSPREMMQRDRQRRSPEPSRGSAEVLQAYRLSHGVNRLLSVSSAPSAASALTFNYSYNDANQRVRVNLADGSLWEYDSLGQVQPVRYNYRHVTIPITSVSPHY